MTRDATPLEDRLDVTPILHGDSGGLRESPPGLALRIPLMLRFVVCLAGEQRCRIDQLPHLVIGPGGQRPSEVSGCLAVGMAATAVVTDLARAQLMPSLRGIQHHAAFVESLKG